MKKTNKFENMVKIFYGFELVALQRKATKGTNAGYTGQLQNNGKTYAYIYPLGICELSKGLYIGEMFIDNIVIDIDTIRKMTLEYFCNKKLCFGYEEDDYIHAISVSVNSKTVDTVLKCLTLNTTPKFYGLCLRDTRDTTKSLISIGTLITSFPVSELTELMALYTEYAANVGNFFEFLLSGKIDCINEKRYNYKSIDVYYKSEFFKSPLRLECKCSTKSIGAKRKSASNTNFIIKFTNR